MKIFWYGHSRYRIETGSSAILIDPFSERRSHVHLPGLDQNADKFVAEMTGGDVALPRAGRAITD
jgi:L-ascorbate metabolism protein UlaG (beta-lactamase superfamily)